MPLMNGFEFITGLKALEHLCHIPLIAYTTSSDPKDKIKSLNLGATSFITKPSSVSLLQQMLQVIFSTPAHVG
jgi:CheY-like chemotaxis protein